MRIAIGQFMEESNTFSPPAGGPGPLRAAQPLRRRDPAGSAAPGPGGAGCSTSSSLPAPRWSRRSARTPCPRAGSPAGVRPREGRAPRAPRPRRAGSTACWASAGAMVLKDARRLALRRGPEGHRPRRPLVAEPPRHDHRRMVQEADALVGYDTYPHIDLYEDRREAGRLILRAVRRDACGRSTLFARAPMLVPAEGQGTSNQPMAGLMAEAKRLSPPASRRSPVPRSSRGSTSPTPGFSVMAVADGPRRAAEIEPMIRQLPHGRPGEQQAGLHRRPDRG